MRFGVYLPTFAWPDLGFAEAARIKDFARKAENLGFDALWVARTVRQRDRRPIPETLVSDG